MSNYPIENEGQEVVASGPGTRPPRLMSYLAMGASVVPFVFAAVLSYKMVFNPEVVNGGVSLTWVWLNLTLWIASIGFVFAARCTSCGGVKVMFAGPGTRHPEDKDKESDTSPGDPGA